MKIVLCHGTFDLIHYGHILLFRAARELGDKLIVTQRTYSANTKIVTTSDEMLQEVLNLKR